MRHGVCHVCGAIGLVRRHHVILEQHVRVEHGDLWDTDNAVWIGVGDEAGTSATCACHRRHHDGAERIPIGKLPLAAIEFARALLGADRAALYFDRFYGAPE